MGENLGDLRGLQLLANENDTMRAAENRADGDSEAVGAGTDHEENESGQSAPCSSRGKSFEDRRIEIQKLREILTKFDVTQDGIPQLLSQGTGPDQTSSAQDDQQLAVQSSTPADEPELRKRIEIVRDEVKELVRTLDVTQKEIEEKKKEIDEMLNAFYGARKELLSSEALGKLSIIVALMKKWFRFFRKKETQMSTPQEFAKAINEIWEAIWNQSCKEDQ
jgi:hypothetical protein